MGITGRALANAQHYTMQAMRRNSYVDILKGLLMFSVVSGHCFYASDWVRDSPPGFIPYFFPSWDMPLFMAISGYFFFKSASKRSVKELLANKVAHILLPCCIGGICICILQELFHTYSYGEGKGWLAPLYSLWFLWSLCICICLCIIPHLISKASEAWAHIAALLISIGLYFIPNILPWHNYNTAYMFPFFYAGYIVCQYKLTTKSRLTYILIFLILLVFLNIALCYEPFSRHFFQYRVWASGTYLMGKLGFLTHLKLNIFRLVMALSGCVAFSGALWYAYSWGRATNLAHWRPIKAVVSFFTRVGEFSLSVYIIQSIVAETLFKSLMNILHENGTLNQVMQIPCPHRLYNLVYLPLTSTLLILICLVIIRVLSRYKATRVMLLGK